MREEEFVKCRTQINISLQKQKWKKGRKEIIEVMRKYLTKPLKCSRDNSGIYLNRLKYLLSAYMYCLDKEHAEGYIIEDIEILHAITCCKAFEKVFEKINEKDQEWINTYCGLATVSQKIYLSQKRKVSAYEEWKNQTDLEKLMRKKRSLERMDNMDHIWHEILNKIKNVRIPKDSLCVEFVCYLDYSLILENTTKRDLVKVSMLLHQEIGEKVYSRWIGEILNFDDINRMIIQYIDSLSSQENVNISLLLKLSEMLLKPIWPYLSNVKTLFWIPDNIFFYFPMEVLFDLKGKRRLLDIYYHVYLDSLLDCEQEEWINISNTNAIVIGAPDYAIIVKDYNQEENKEIEEKMKQFDIKDLLCSKKECEIIGELCHTVPFVGEQANKASFFENCETSEIIHLSTHGDIFDSVLFDKIPSAGMFLILSGYKNWYVGKYAPSYGNGCLTAQEITMTDLRKVKLVVISSCISALNKYKNDGSVISLRGAFEAAGARQTIAALWEVDDCATAILMVLFYRYLYKNAPSVALCKAKQKIRELDYREIRNDIALFSVWQESKEKVLPDYVRPFADEKYWAAFIFHRNGV